MATIDQAYNSMADINLWFKIRSGDDIMLADMPSIIPLRWSYFQSNWNFLKQNLIDDIGSNPNPDFFRQQIDDFSNFIESQLSSSSKINPFSDGKIFHRFYAVFDAINVDTINLTNQEQQILDS
jgi:hypothetical protein